jgi:hypothetical protein
VLLGTRLIALQDEITTVKFRFELLSERFSTDVALIVKECEPIMEVSFVTTDIVSPLIVTKTEGVVNAKV